MCIRDRAPPSHSASDPQLTASDSQTSARPPPKPKVSKPIDSRAQLPARTMRSAHESLLPYIFLDGPEQTARLVQVAVVGPAVEGGEALLATAGTATAVADAVGARAVPRHADE